jgi:hypothetical protein
MRKLPRNMNTPISESTIADPAGVNVQCQSWVLPTGRMKMETKRAKTIAHAI